MAAIDLLSPKAASRLIAATSASLTAVTVDSVDGTVPAGGTGADAGAYDTAVNRNTAIATLTETLTSVNELITKLGTMGLPITAS